MHPMFHLLKSVRGVVPICAILCLARPLAAQEPVDPDPLAENPPAWIDEPILLNSTIDPATADKVSKYVRKALEKVTENKPLYGGAALLERALPQKPTDNRVQTARSLLAKGEENYMSFKFNVAATTLSESADIFTSSLADLSTADVDLLYRARLIEGMSWLEAGQAQKAKEAFGRLVIIRQDFEPDPSMVSPKATEVFREALADLRAAGLATLEVRSEPTGAEVILDGQPRGTTPIAITPVPKGHHLIRLKLPGFQNYDEEIEVIPPGRTSRSVVLVSTPLQVSLNRIRKGAQDGLPPQMLERDLEELLRSSRLETAIFMGISRHSDEPGSLVLNLVRHSLSGHSAVTALTSDAKLKTDILPIIRLLLADSWPAATYPANSSGFTSDFTKMFLGLSLAETIQHPEQQQGGSIFTQWWFWTLSGGTVAALSAGGILTALYWKDLFPPTPPVEEKVKFQLNYQ